MSEGTIDDVLANRAAWAVVQGDCAKTLPTLGDKSVAHVITDPPYEAAAHAAHSRQNADHELVESILDFPAITDAERGECARAWVRATTGWVLAFCQVEGVDRWKASLEAAGAKWRKAAAWVKPDSQPNFSGNGWAPGFECIASAWCGVGRSEWNGGGKRGVFEHCVNNFGRLTSGREHPTMKPVPLMLELVELFTDPDELVLDPFCGSGTTGVACLRLGRRFIGIEREQKYAEIARERLRAETQGLTLRDARSGQMGLFGAK